MKRRMMVASVLAILAATMAGGIASAHVHGITPLLQLDEASVSGGNGTNGTPADDANGGPISGLIPRDTGNSPLDIGDGGFGAIP